MELSIIERMVLLQLLPEKGDYTTLKIVRTKREELSFSEEELKGHNFRVEDDRHKWDGESSIEVEFGGRVRKLVIEALEKLNDDEEMEDPHISLYEKFGLAED